MKCEVCGNTDVNRIVIFYRTKAVNEKILGDDTTLTKFLYEIMYPERRRKNIAVPPHLIGPEKLVALRIRSIRCEKCLEEGRGEVEIKPTRYGV